MDGWKRGCHFVNNSLEWSPPILDSKPEWYYACSTTQSRCTLYGHTVSLGWLSSILKSTGAGIVSHCIRWDPFSIFNHSLSDMNIIVIHIIITSLYWSDICERKRVGKIKKKRLFICCPYVNNLSLNPTLHPKWRLKSIWKNFTN